MRKQAKLAAQARLPEAARPLARLTRFDSAMPTLKKRSGNFFAKCSVRVELFTSPSTTTISGLAAPTWASARPKASRVDLPSFMSGPSREFRRTPYFLLVRDEIGEADRLQRLARDLRSKDSSGVNVESKAPSRKGRRKSGKRYAQRRYGRSTN